jgi:hypothetical protein
MNRRMFVTVLAAGAGCCTQAAFASASCTEDNDLVISRILGRMQTIKPGMNRTQFLSVFRPEGGLHEVPLRTYRSRDCSYFAVDVTFHSGDGRHEAESLIESPHDLILTISAPYLKPYEAAD